MHPANGHITQFEPGGLVAPVQGELQFFGEPADQPMVLAGAQSRRRTARVRDPPVGRTQELYMDWIVNTRRSLMCGP